MLCTLFGILCLAHVCEPDFSWTRMDNGEQICWPTKEGLERINERCSLAYAGKAKYRPTDLCVSDPNSILKTR